MTSVLLVPSLKDIEEFLENKKDLKDGQARCIRCNEPMSVDNLQLCEDCEEFARQEGLGG